MSQRARARTLRYSGTWRFTHGTFAYQHAHGRGKLVGVQAPGSAVTVWKLQMRG